MAYGGLSAREVQGGLSVRVSCLMLALVCSGTHYGAVCVGSEGERYESIWRHHVRTIPFRDGARDKDSAVDAAGITYLRR